MQYALLHRFQGVLLGATLGEILGLQWVDQSRRRRQALPVELTSAFAQPLKTRISALALHYAQAFASHGQVDWVADRAQTPWSHYGLEPTAITPSEAAIALLPIALFCHEADWLLDPQLQSAVIAWENEGLDQAGVGVMARAIAQLLREQSSPLTLIPYLLREVPPLSSLYQSLETIQDCVEQAAGLEMTRQAVGSSSLMSAAPIALAFYCFLSTPNDFHLAVLRAIRLGLPTATVPALVGALAGAYNGVSGIPISWRLAAPQWHTPTGKAVTVRELLQLAHQLLTTWAGVTLPPAPTDSPLLAIAAPQVIRQVPDSRHF
jgi:ADP-ribosylglycohydrolase